MASEPITVQFDTSQVDAALMKKVRALRDVKPLLEQIGLLLTRSIKKNFKQGGRPDKWKKSKRARKQGGLTLMDRGSAGLYGSITMEVEAREVAVGTIVPYAPMLHFGGTINHPGGTPYIVTDKGAVWMKKDGNYPEGVKFTKAHEIPMPARPFLMFQPEDYRRINQLMQKHVDGA